VRRLLKRQELGQQAADEAALLLPKDEATTELPRRGWTEAERVDMSSGLLKWIIKCVYVDALVPLPGKMGSSLINPKGRVVISGAIEVEAGRIELATPHTQSRSLPLSRTW
jgi:hypothetical protein